MENFKTIQSFPDYEVSNMGRIRTKARLIRYVHSVTKNEHFRNSENKLLKIQFNNRTGYKFVQLYLNKKMHNITIHRLVAEAFIENTDNLSTVNHKDGNKHNNTVDNLEWCSNEYNHQHATETGLKPKGSKIGSSKLNENCVHAIKYFLKQGYSHSQLSEIFLISRASVSLISEGKTWKHVALTGEELMQVSEGKK